MCNVPSDKTRDGIADMGCTKEGSNITDTFFKKKITNKTNFYHAYKTLNGSIVFFKNNSRQYCHTVSVVCSLLIGPHLLDRGLKPLS